MKALIISADGFEDMELFYPLYRLREEGWDVTLASPRKNTITGKHGYEASVDALVSGIRHEDYDLLLIPGGKAPEEVRLDSDSLMIVDWFIKKKLPVGAICHGAQVLISAGVVKGRKLTCWKGVKDDVIAAGGEYVDTEVVVDGMLVTSRMPDDLPAFMRELNRLTAAAAGKSGKKKAA